MTAGQPAFLIACDGLPLVVTVVCTRNTGPPLVNNRQQAGLFCQP